MNRADDDEPGGRRVDVEKQFFAAGLAHAALAHPQLLCEIGAQRVAGDVGGLDQPLLAIGGIGDHDHRPPRGALGIDLCPCFKLHNRPTFSTNTRMLPPPDRPTFQAASSAPPTSPLLPCPPPLP